MNDKKKKGRLKCCLYGLVRWLNRITSPEGCTAVDARKLREYNHSLANELDFYKQQQKENYEKNTREKGSNQG